MSGEREALERAAARLGEVVARIAAADAPPQEARALAEEALELSGRISELLPRALGEVGKGP